MFSIYNFSFRDFNIQPHDITGFRITRFTDTIGIIDFADIQRIMKMSHYFLTVHLNSIILIVSYSNRQLTTLNNGYFTG